MNKQIKTDVNGHEWVRGNKYYQRWENYTVTAFGKGKNPQGAQCWHFAAYYNKLNCLGVFDYSNDARKKCHDHYKEILKMNG